MHGNTIVIKKNYDRIKIKNTYVPGLFDKPSHLTKIILKKPLSRGSRFKIYFCLERRENRRSRLNFHGIPFFKDRVLIKPKHSVSCHAETTYSLKDQDNLNMNMQIKMRIHELTNSYPKYEIRH